MAETITRTERGWAGHFICGYRCRFHRNTLLTKGNRHIVVSTVGDMMGERFEGVESIGYCDKPRFYETMVFRGQVDAPYIEMDVSHQLYTDGLEWAICATDAKSLPADADIQADAMHESTVAYSMTHFDATWEKPNV